MLGSTNTIHLETIYRSRSTRSGRGRPPNPDHPRPARPAETGRALYRGGVSVNRLLEALLPRPRFLAALFLFAAVALAGCSGGDEGQGRDGTTAAATTTSIEQVLLDQPRELTPTEVEQALGSIGEEVPADAIQVSGSQIVVQGPSPAEVLLYGVTLVIVDGEQASLFAAAAGIAPTESGEVPTAFSAGDCSFSALVAPNVLIRTQPASRCAPLTELGWDRSRLIQAALALKARVSAEARPNAEEQTATGPRGSATETPASDGSREEAARRDISPILEQGIDGWAANGGRAVAVGPTLSRIDPNYAYAAIEGVPGETMVQGGHAYFRWNGRGWEAIGEMVGDSSAWCGRVPDAIIEELSGGPSYC